jgi:hypothetical protein
MLRNLISCAIDGRKVILLPWDPMEKGLIDMARHPLYSEIEISIKVIPRSTYEKDFGNQAYYECL